MLTLVSSAIQGDLWGLINLQFCYVDLWFLCWELRWYAHALILFQWLDFQTSSYSVIETQEYAVFLRIYKFWKLFVVIWPYIIAQAVLFPHPFTRPSSWVLTLLIQICAAARYRGFSTTTKLHYAPLINNTIMSYSSNSDLFYCQGCLSIYSCCGTSSQSIPFYFSLSDCLAIFILCFWSWGCSHTSPDQCGYPRMNYEPQLCTLFSCPFPSFS